MATTYTIWSLGNHKSVLMDEATSVTLARKKAYAFIKQDKAEYLEIRKPTKEYTRQGLNGPIVGAVTSNPYWGIYYRTRDLNRYELKSNGSLGRRI